MTMVSTERSEWAIYEIAKPATDIDIAMYRSIRLAGLFTNPEAFGSTFARESSFSEETWVSRVNTNGRCTLLAALPTMITAEEAAIGTLSVLGPEMLAGSPQDPVYPHDIARDERAGNLDVYMLVGMWVRPEYRCKGVGKALVDRAYQVVEDGGVDKNVGKRVILLLVHDDQNAAMHLYRKAGYVEQGAIEHAGRPSTWMARPVL